MPKMKPKPQQPQIDLSFARAATLLLPAHDRLRLVLVGCGGTGSWLAPSVARIARVLRDQHKDVSVVFCDPDRVEQKNIPRQNFCQAELGVSKSETLALRLSSAWGIEIESWPTPFKAAEPRHDTMTLLIGCVDNAAARQALSRALQHNAELRGSELGTWWLDCGNTDDAGQVLFGSAYRPDRLKGAFKSRKICILLPSPALVAPDLLEPRPEELTAKKMSCAEIQAANNQSLAVNQQVAAVATDYLLRLVSGGLKRFATYFDLESGSMRSRSITPEEIAGLARKPVDYVIAK